MSRLVSSVAAWLATAAATVSGAPRRPAEVAIVAVHVRVAARALPALAPLWDAPLQAEEARALAAEAPEGTLALRLDPGREALLVADGSSYALGLEPCLARALEALSRHEDAVDLTRLRPVGAQEVERALRSPATLVALQAAFAEAWAGPRATDRSLGAETPFEPGGIAYLVAGRDGPTLHFVKVEDPVHRLARAVAVAAREPDAIPSLLEKSPVFAYALDANGLLRAFLERHPRGSRDAPRARRALDLVVNALLANAADSYGVDDEGLAVAVARERPAGRFVGLWHGHPGRRGGDLPSEEDRTVAAATGRFLTFVERPGGFDAYDLRREELHPPIIPLR